MGIERLLRLTADYHSFCSSSYAESARTDFDEMSAEELDLIAAAQSAPVKGVTDERDPPLNISESKNCKIQF